MAADTIRTEALPEWARVLLALRDRLQPEPPEEEPSRS